MGKGKKKGGKPTSSKEVEQTSQELQSLTVSEVPSTSQDPVEDPDDGEGLTGSKKKNKPKKTTTQTVVSEVPTVSSSETTEKPSVQSAPPAEPVEEEDGGLGLGIGGRKKNRPRKKKADTPTETSQQIPKTSQAPVQDSAGVQQNIPTQSVRSQPGIAEIRQPPQSGPRNQSAPWARMQDPPQRPQVELAKQKPIEPKPSPSTGGVQACPSPSYTAIPSAAQSQVAPSQTPRNVESSVMCRFQVPKKIIGRSVPARPITVLTNYLPMTIKPLKIYRYDVSFVPDRPKKMIPVAFMEAKKKHFAKTEMAFDQMKNCYTLVALPKVSQNERFSTNVDLLDNNGKNMKFEVSFKFTGIVDLATIMNYMRTGGTSLSPPSEAIQCIDVILRQGTLESYVKAGRQFFRRPANPIYLGDGLEMWTGLFQSGIFTSRAFINIDVAHKGFPKQQPLIDALVKDFRLDTRKPLEKQQQWIYERFLSFLKGLRVMASIGGDNTRQGQRREFICNGLVRPANAEKFNFENPVTKAKETMTVADYFAREKNYRVRYPDLNCVWVGPRDKTIYYPMELLEIVYGQAQNKQLNETQLSTMVREAATPPDIRKKKIEEVIENMKYSKNTTFKNFGLEISDQFYSVNAKVLMPPRLEVGNGQVIQPRRGVWQSDGVYRPEALQSWGFIAIECDSSGCDFDAIIKMTMKIGTQMGMRVSPPGMTLFHVKMRELQKALFTALEKEIRFLFIVVSTRGHDYYHRVKQMAEREVGILTQCIKEQTAARRMNPQTVRNILLKVNSKLMGINQALDSRTAPNCLREGGVMVVGADVTHPSPDQSTIPSIAAVTASLDAKCTLYNIELSVQTPKKEVIVEFEEMMVDHFKVYQKHQKTLPKKIFIFRDGVSEGQFAQVMNCELQAVHNAYKIVAGPNAKPEVLFLLVQKRHHTRMFVPNSNQNVEPGTVVDTDIVHASELDFYLVSHQAIKGTARPTRYHAVCNDGKIPHDEVEQLTYYLCHLYSRCMRSVSYPTPTYYAHLACLRARSLTHGERFDNKELERKPKRLRVMDKILQYSRMFFV